MPLLAFDTSTAACAVYVRLPSGENFAETPSAERLFTRPAHARELLPAIDRVCRQAGIAIGDLSAVAVGVGPGAFTGLRIGIATARAIAAANDLPITPVSSLAALARGTEPGVADGVTVAVNDARRSEYFSAAYSASGEAVVPDGARDIEDLQALARPLARNGAAIAVGDGAIKLRERFEELGFEVPTADDRRHVITGESVAALAAALAPIRVAELTPNYLRPPDAVESSRESWAAAATGGET